MSQWLKLPVTASCWQRKHKNLPRASPRYDEELRRRTETSPKLLSLKLLACSIALISALTCRKVISVKSIVVARIPCDQLSPFVVAHVRACPLSVAQSVQQCVSCVRCLTALAIEIRCPLDSGGS